MYNKSAEYANQLAKSGVGSEYYKEARQTKVSLIQKGMNINNACSKFAEYFQIMKTHLPEPLQAAVDAKGGNLVCQWWQAKSEFVTLYTGCYLKAWADKDKHAISSLFQTIRNVYMPSLHSRNFSKLIIASDPNRMENHVSKKVNFCTLLSILVNVYTGMAGGQLAVLKTLGGDDPSQVAPNNLKRTSYTPRVLQMYRWL
jgi:hypothetical protein